MTDKLQGQVQATLFGTLMLLSLSVPVALAKSPTYAGKMELGNQLYFNGNMDGAIRAFEYAAYLKPDSFEPHLNLVNLYVQKGGKENFEKAVEKCHTVLKMKPAHKDVHLILGNLLRTQAGQTESKEEMEQKLGESIKEIQAAKDLGANDAMCENTIGLALLQKGETDEALKHIDMALKEQFKFADAHMVKAILLFKNATKIDPATPDKKPDLTSPEMKAKFAEVIKELDLAVSQKGKNAEARNTKADILFATGKTEEALHEYKKATEDDPRFGQAWTGVGNIEVSLKHYKEGAEAFRKAVDINQKDKNSWYGLGVCEEKLNNTKEAVDAFHQGLMLETDPQMKMQIHQHIVQLNGGTLPGGMAGMGGFMGGFGSAAGAAGQVGPGIYGDAQMMKPYADLIKIKK